MRWHLLQRPIHVSWLVALGCLLFVVGVWWAVSFSVHEWWLFCVGGLFIGVGLWHRRLYVVPLVIVGGAALGLWYGSVSAEGLGMYAPLRGKQVTVSGRIKEDPTQNIKHQTVIQLDGIVIANHELPGSVWASLLGHTELKRGDVATIEGVLEEGFGTFSGVLYTARIVGLVHPQPGDMGRIVRDWFADAVRRAIPEPQASLGIGYISGQKSALPDDLAKALQIAGLSHIVVASGYNLTILVRLARRLFVKVSKYLSLVMASVMIVGFVAVTGLSPSMSRAGLVSGLSLATWYYGRQFHPFVLLPFAAAITVLWQPSYVWGDLGWQLSFSAFAAVMIVGPLLQRYFFGEKEPGTIRQILGETVAAHIVTVPIVVIAFGVLSNVAIPANILIVPLVPLAMLLTFISGIAGLIVPLDIASIVGLPATWLLSYMTQTAQYLADLPWSQTKIEMPWWGVVIYYAALIGICVYAWRVTKFTVGATNIVK